MPTLCRQQVFLWSWLWLPGAQLRFNEAFQTEGHSGVPSNRSLQRENQYTNPKELHTAQWQLRDLNRRNRMSWNCSADRQSSTQPGVNLRMLWRKQSPCSRQGFFYPATPQGPILTSTLLPQILVTLHMNTRAKERKGECRKDFNMKNTVVFKL